MQRPNIGILSSLSAARGLDELLWYHNLSEIERAEADRLAGVYARNICRKALDELSACDLRLINEIVQANFAA